MKTLRAGLLLGYNGVAVSSSAAYEFDVATSIIMKPSRLAAILPPAACHWLCYNKLCLYTCLYVKY